MKCPVCHTVDLVMSDRQGVEIDYCPQCRGVWLDRGELDKIIERSVSGRAVSAQPAMQNRNQQGYDNDHRDGHDHARHKRKSFWHDLFD